MPPQLFSAEALGLAEAGSGEARRGMERLNSAEEARASMQRARSAEATLSGMTLGAGGGDPALGRRCGGPRQGLGIKHDIRLAGVHAVAERLIACLAGCLGEGAAGL